MEKICDLHIHSKYSGGTSTQININKIAHNSNIKGIEIIGTGDCFHPLWLKELQENLCEYSNGIFFLPKTPRVKFILQSEVELMWTQNSQIKKVHFIVLVPNFDKLKEIYEFIINFGNLKIDGRPVLNISAEKFILKMNNIDDMIEVIPAHIFTPFYGILGSKLHFNSLKEAIGQGINYIHAIETGLSADPSMIRQLSELNNLSIISNSDSHSLNFHRLGREATALELNNIDYHNVIESIRKKKITKTYEFNPSEGKYYYDGHRSDRHSSGKDYFCSPKRNLINCPVCGKMLTKGVLSRVYELKDQEIPVIENFQYIIPLLHLIAIVYGGSEYSKYNVSLYRDVVNTYDGEFNIWNKESVFEEVPFELSNAIEKVKSGKYWFIPGHDGVYGELQFEA